MCWDLFGPTRMHSDTFGYVGKRSEAFGRFRNFSDFFSIFFALVPNTGEANDEMCVPTCPNGAENLRNVLSQAIQLFVVVVVAALPEKTKTGFAGNNELNLKVKQTKNQIQMK